MGVLGIALDARGAKFKERHKLTFMVVDGSDKKVWSHFGKGYIPHNVVVDAGGVVRYTDSGADLEPILEALRAAVADRDAEEEG